jgi:hypothetical protein
MHFVNSLQRVFLDAFSTIEYNIINIDFYKQDILPVLFVKKMVLILPILKPLSIRKDFNISYHALGACKG